MEGLIRILFWNGSLVSIALRFRQCEKERCTDRSFSVSLLSYFAIVLLSAARVQQNKNIFQVVRPFESWFQHNILQTYLTLTLNLCFFFTLWFKRALKGYFQQKIKMDYFLSTLYFLMRLWEIENKTLLSVVLSYVLLLWF